MKKKYLKPALQSVLILVAYLPFLAATTGDQYTGPIPEFSGRIDDFAFDLLKYEAASHDASSSGGALLSPFSIYSCMAMGYIASGGNTRTGLAQALHFPADNAPLMRDLPALREKISSDGNRPGVELRMGESVWLDTTYAHWRADYLHNLGRMGAEPPRNVKFADQAASCADINAWVTRMTKNRITQVIQPADIPSRSHPGVIDEPGLVTVDAVWFKAQWMHEFDTAATGKHLFNTPGGTTDTPMMHQNSVFLYSEDPHCQLLIMPYLGGRFSMVVLLPRDVEDAATMTASLTREKMQELLTGVRPATVDILFPKFTIKRHTDLEKPLVALGAGEAFDKGNANFDAMIVKTFPAYRVYLSSVKHDTWMQVSEEGTEAAAATTAVYYTIGCAAQEPPPPVAFHADHPFLFFIVHNPDRTILFAGWVTNPAALDAR